MDEPCSKKSWSILFDFTPTPWTFPLLSGAPGATKVSAFFTTRVVGARFFPSARFNELR